MNASPDAPIGVPNDDSIPPAEVVPAVVVAKPGFFLDETQRLRTVWRFLIFGAGFVIINVAIGVVGGIAAGIWLMVTQGPEAFQQFDAIEEQIALYTPHIMAVACLPTTAAMLAWVIICRKYLDRRSIASMGFVRLTRRSLIVGFIAGVLPIVAAGGAVAAAGGFRMTGVGFSVIAGVLVPTLILMAFTEEVVFRSYLLQNLLDIRRPAFGVIFTSFFFWLAHALNPHVWSSPIVPINMFGAGVILALAYMLSRNVWFPTALHFGWNVAQGVLLSLPISGMPIEGIIRLRLIDEAPAWLTGGGFGLEASIAVTVVEVLMICGFLLVLQRRVRS